MPVSQVIFSKYSGKNPQDVPVEMVKFLEFVHSDLADSMRDFGDEYINDLQKTIAQIKSDREVGTRYMLFEEYIREEREEARAEGLVYSILKILENKFSLCPEMKEKIKSVQDLELLDMLLMTAITATDLKEIEEKL